MPGPIAFIAPGIAHNVDGIKWDNSRTSFRVGNAVEGLADRVKQIKKAIARVGKKCPNHLETTSDEPDLSHTLQKAIGWFVHDLSYNHLPHRESRWDLSHNPTIF